MAQSADPAASASLSDKHLRAEQIELLFTHGPSLLLGNTLGVISVTLMLWQAFELHVLLMWLGAIAVLTLARIAMVTAHNGRWRNRLSTDAWGVLFIAGAALSGIGWGCLAYITSNTDPLTLAAIGMILAGLTGAAAPALGTLYLAYVLYALAALIPYAVLCFTQSHPLAFGMGFIAVSYFLCTLIFGWVNNRFTKGSIRLRFENHELLRQLQVQTQAAERARYSAETANSGKTRFLAAASHDMRQPLQSISLLADALQAEPLTPAAERLLASMREATTSMGELMDELMDYSRIDSGTLQAEFRSFNLAPLLIRIEAEFAPLAAQRGLRLHIRHRPVRVLSDPRMVERILRNLVSNAVKYTASGGILVACRPRGKHLRLEVWDSGIGIPMDKQDEVFREFYQLDNPERDRRKGLGLGLAIVDGLVRLLGQRLELRSIEGKGSVFSVALPLDTTQQAKTEILRPELPVLPQNISRVLVIDNEPIIQQAMSALLAAWGCKPIAAESLEDALAQLDSAPDAILADYRLLEGRTGIEAIEGVRKHFNVDIPAAVITGDTDPHRLAEARSSGFPLLQKPTPSGHLREVLSTLLQTTPAHP
ncbi:hybrid sensor histidine kinase/response regulator [Uliginosibacterium sp. H3]|uniref:histidine kinase n=1 Tax=Uliginosibacterium silvisoli TaxID=3114758 RepID=A0ABU6K3G2_9RHOO|nr:hybrid sensor histidine kinase/response regulator [Uliginosibacterium sp. H3]